MSVTLAPESFGINGLAGLEQNTYYWVRHPEGTRFVAKLENDCWWSCGMNFAVNVTRDQVICQVKPSEN